MQQDSTNAPITFLIGDSSFLQNCLSTKVMVPFDETVVDYLDCVSRNILSRPECKAFPDVITFAFWIRRASMMAYKKKYAVHEDNYVVGKGVVLHIAPSNVAVNFAYSLVSGLIAGNINIVRVPSKGFQQVDLIVTALKSALDKYKDIVNYICLVKYGHEKSLNDMFSALSDVRVVWGGDSTISVFRESPLRPRSTEILFANRFSIAVIDSDYYLNTQDKSRVALNFYNDTYLTDQNACSSPRLIVWVGNRINEAKELFWQICYKIVSEKYHFQQMQGVEKYLQVCMIASNMQGVRKEFSRDNLITRIHIDVLNEGIVEYFGNSGFFVEYDASDISDIGRICNDGRCQTIAYVGDVSMFDSILSTGLRGVDRIVPFGKTMDFELIWDGYDLMSYLTRTIRVRAQ